MFVLSPFAFEFRNQYFQDGRPRESEFPAACS